MSFPSLTMIREVSPGMSFRSSREAFRAAAMALVPPGLTMASKAAWKSEALYFSGPYLRSVWDRETAPLCPKVLKEPTCSNPATDAPTEPRKRFSSQNFLSPLYLAHIDEDASITTWKFLATYWSLAKEGGV